MKLADVLSIFLTFLIGLLVGAYFYITGMANFIASFTTPTAEEVRTFQIVGDVYGGCRAACPSFLVTSDGSYRYLYTPLNAQDAVIREGSLPRNLQRRLESVLVPTTLAQQAAPREPVTCNSYVDGIDVEYTISVDGTDYTLDSCGTQVIGDSALWVVLGEVWTHFETAGNN
jgi:hypothetical protein